MSTESNTSADRGRKLPFPRWLVITAGVLVLVIVGGAIALKLAFPPEKLRAMVVPRIEERVGREVELASVRLKLFPRVAVRLDGLAVANPPGFADEPTFELDALELDLRIWPLILRREIELGEVRIVRPLIRYQVRADGTSNFDGLGPADTSAAATADGEGQPTDDPAAAAAGAFFVSDLRLIDGTVLYSNARDARHARMTLEARAAVERSAAGARAMEGRGTVDVRSIVALAPALGEDSVALPDLAIEYDVFADLPGDSLIVRDLQLDVGEFPLSGAGSVRRLTGERIIDFAIESGDVDIARLLASLPPALAARFGSVEAAGSAKLSLGASGAMATEEGPRIDGTLAVESVDAAHADHGQLLSGGAGRLTFTKTSVAIPEFDAQLWGRPFSLQLAIDDLETMVARGAVSGELDLARVAALRDAPVPVNGTASFDVEFSGPIKEPARLRLTGPIGLDRVSYQSPSLAVPAVVSAATLRLTGDGLTAERIPVQMGGSDLALSVNAPGVLAYLLSEEKSGPRPVVEFGLTSEKLDLGELLPTTEVGYGGLVAARLAGKRVDGRDPAEIAREKYPVPALPPVNARGRVRIAELVNPPTQVRNLSFQLSARDGVIELTDLQGRTYGGRLTGRVSLDAGGGLPPFPLEYDLNLQEANAAGVVRRWTRLGAPISGQLNFVLKGSGAIDETMLPAPQALVANGDARFRDGAFERDFPVARALVERLQIDPQKLLGFQNFGGAFEIRGGNFVLDGWRLAGADVSASIGGVAGLGGALDLQLQLSLPLSTLRQAGFLQGGTLGDILKEVAGRDESVDLSVGVGGSMSDPQLQLDTQSLQRELARRLEGRGRGLLDRLLRPPPDTGGTA